MPVELIALGAPAVLLAYAVFGMTGFGAAMVAVPILVQVMPLQLAVPMVVLFDLVCTALVGGSNWRRVCVPELKRIVPWMLLGIGVGVTLLHHLGARWPLIALGSFVLLVCARNLLTRAGAPRPPIARRWVLPFGVAGGVFSALFGTGGPVYTLYLQRRLPEVDQFRATISVVILLSGISRALAFGASGLYAQPAILWLAAALLPVSLLGVFIGSRLRTRVSPAALQRLVLLLLAVAGVAAITRGVMAPA